MLGMQCNVKLLPSEFGCGAQVRGAYIVIENERAAAQGYSSPIHDCIQDTHANYDRCG